MVHATRATTITTTAVAAIVHPLSLQPHIIPTSKSNGSSSNSATHISSVPSEALQRNSSSTTTLESAIATSPTSVTPTLTATTTSAQEVPADIDTAAQVQEQEQVQEHHIPELAAIAHNKRKRASRTKEHKQESSLPTPITRTTPITITTTTSSTSSSSAPSSSSSPPALKHLVKPSSPPDETAPFQPGAALPKLTKLTKLPKLTAFHLLPEQLRHPLFLAIIRVLVARGNNWQSATDLVEGIRHFKLASLGGQTPRSSIQGAISTALTTAHRLGTFEPIDKSKMTSTTYYRVAPRALDPTLHSDSEATESDSNGKVKRKDVPNGSSTNGQSASSKPRTRTRAATTTNVKRKGRHSASSNGDNSSNSSIINNGAGQSGGRGNKRKPVSGWSDTLSSDSSEDDTRQHASVGRRKINHTHNNQQVSASATKRTRIGSPTARSSSRQKVPARRDSIPNGLKKLPKGYVYDTEINQAALMRLSVNPSQTGEYMRHLRGRNAEENNFPDKRGNYGVDLTQEPSMFALEQQTGYTYPRLRNGGKERLPKGSCEDGYAVADLKQVGGGFLGRLFCITDGHGGSQCSSFVVATIPGAMQVIFGKYKPSDLSIPAVQELVKNQITEAIRLIDKEYLDYKKQQYLRYKEKKLTRDPGSDGTTLIVNIFIGNWIICLNLGDSRTMMGSRDLVGRWNVDFYSEDHTPALERLAQTIYANGGEFVTHDDKVIRFDPTMKNDKKHRQSLKEARIRVKDGESNQYGIPFRTKNGHCASVNLGACIGDVLYKLDPINPVLSCKPDITFIDISEVQQGFLLMASDGLWDYVQRGGKIHDQNATVCQFVGDKLDRGWNHQRIVYTLSDREGAPTGLYSDSIQEYDDFTAILVSFNKQQLHRQQRMHKDYELKQLQILMLHEQQQKQREMERQQELKKLQAQQVLAAEVERLRQEQALLRKAKADRGEGSDSEMETKPKIKPKVNGVAEVVKMESLTAADSVSTLAATTTVAANATAVAAATQISSSSSTVRATSSGGQWHPA